MAIDDGHRSVQRHTIVQFILEDVQIVQTIGFLADSRFQREGFSMLGNALNKHKHFQLANIEDKKY